MSLLTSEELKNLCRAPSVRSLCYGERLMEAPRYVLDQTLLWHAQARREELTDITMLNGEEELVWAEGWEHDEHTRSCPVLGVLLWTPQDDGSWWTELGYVAESARRQNVYTLLWGACVFKAKKRGVRLIQGGTACLNTRMQEVMQRLGRRASYIVYDFDVAAHG